MADGFKFKLNIAGFRDLRKSSEVEADLEERAARMVDVLGEGFGAFTAPGRNRARVTVHTDSDFGAAKNAVSQDLIRAIDAAR